MSNSGPTGPFELAALGGFGIVPGEPEQRDSPISPVHLPMAEGFPGGTNSLDHLPIHGISLGDPAV